MVKPKGRKPEKPAGTARRQKAAAGTPSYHNPPLVEVVFGVVFEPLPGFSIRHIAALWNKFGAEFPNFQQTMRLGSLPDQFDFASILPRVWMVNKYEDKLLQIQDDRFLFNWRKRSKGGEYPRYLELIQVFKENFKTLNDILGELGFDELRPTEYELTYVNHLEQGDLWQNPADIGRVLPDVAWQRGSKRFLKELSDIAWRLRFSFDEDHDYLDVRLNRATRKTDEVSIFTLNLTAKGKPNELANTSMWQWFDHAHEKIVRGFADLTDADIQRKIWKRYE